MKRKKIITQGKESSPKIITFHLHLEIQTQIVPLYKDRCHTMCSSTQTSHTTHTALDLEIWQRKFSPERADGHTHCIYFAKKAQGFSLEDPVLTTGARGGYHIFVFFIRDRAVWLDGQNTQRAVFGRYARRSRH